MLELAINGLVVGGVYAAVAISIVLMFRTLGTVNFASTTIGGLGAVAALMAVESGAPPIAGLLVGILTAALIGAAVGGLMIWRFGGSESTTRSTVTIVLLVAGMALGTRLLGSDAHVFPDMFGRARIVIGEVPVPVATVVEVIGVLVLAFGGSAFLRLSRTGVQLRALSTRPVTAALVGIRVKSLTVGVWVITSAVTALAICVVLPTSTFSFATTTSLLIGALAAALIGLLRSLPIAALGGLALGILQALAVQWPLMVDLNQVIPFAVIIAILFWWRRNDAWSEAR